MEVNPKSMMQLCSFSFHSTRSSGLLISFEQAGGTERDTMSTVRIVDTAPSSPGRSSSCSNLSEDFYFSEPTSPTHFLTRLLQNSVSDSASAKNLTRAVNSIVKEEYVSAQDPKMCEGMKAFNGGFEFEFSSRCSDDQPFAEELFLNGQIRPLNQQTKSENIVSPRPPLCPGSKIRPLNAFHPADEDEFHDASKSNDRREYSTKIGKGRRNFLWEKCVNENRIHGGMKDTGTIKLECGRGSKRWRLKDFLDGSSRDRKRGRDRDKGLNIPPAKQAQKHSMKKLGTDCSRYDETKIIFSKSKADGSRRKSFLPYKRGLLGCFMNGLTINLHPFSSL